MELAKITVTIVFINSLRFFFNFRIQGTPIMVWKWTKRIGIGGLSVVSFCLIFGILYQSIATKLDEQKYPPFGQMIDVGGFRLHLFGTGKIDGPVVILEAGLGSHSLDWALVQSSVSEFARVYSYDRAGYGWSEESPNERTSINMVEELHTLLNKAGISGPYILVGHSLGGINVRLFASRYPNEVAGVVLVDSSHEDQFDNMPKLAVPNQTLIHLINYLGIIRLLSYSAKYQATNEVYGKLPENIQQIKIVQDRATKTIKTVFRENSFIQTSLLQLKNDGGNLGNIPLIVITARQTMPPMDGSGITQEEIDKFHPIFLELQKDLLKKSAHSTQIFAEESDHNIPLRQPEIIVKAIQSIIECTY